MDQESIVGYYTQFADTYDATIAQDQDYTAYQTIPTWVLQQLKPSPCVIADLGCGTGLAAAPFIQRGDHIIGVDLTPKMLEKASQLGYQELICHNLDQPLPFATAHFDAAFLIGVMEFIQRPFALFKELRRILREGGLLGLTLPETLPPDIETLIGIHTYSPLVYEALFKSLGFSIQRQERFQGFISKGHTVTYIGYLLRAETFSFETTTIEKGVLTIKETLNKGRGIFATRKIKQGSFLERAPILILGADEWKHIALTNLYHYAFEWGKNSLDAALALGFGSLYNHDIQPNAYYLRREEAHALDFFALRNIEEGEEILINYNGEPSCKDLVWFQEKEAL